MPLEDILDALDKDGYEQEQDIKTRAKEQIKGILEQAEKDAEIIRKQSVGAMGKTITRETSKIISDARLQVRKQIIVAKEQLIDEVFVKADSALKKVRNSPEYPGILERLIRETVGHGQGDMAISVNPADNKLAAGILGKLGIACPLDTDIRCTGGLRATSADKRVCFDNTLESRLERAKQFTKSEITNILFG